MSQKKNNQKGFTLIELVIVLAIGALIIAGVLLAVRGAQQSRRDTERKNFAATTGSNLEQSASNHSGAYPSQTGGATIANFNAQYVTNQTDPGGSAYPAASVTGTYGTCPASGVATGVMQISYSGRQWQVAMGLENGDVYCTRS
jgi:prepilin-type N-terminal cleavage/methylation domain-containing protein